jgi:hypothetical protein
VGICLKRSSKFQKCGICSGFPRIKKKTFNDTMQHISSILRMKREECPWRHSKLSKHSWRENERNSSISETLPSQMDDSTMLFRMSHSIKSRYRYSILLTSRKIKSRTWPISRNSRKKKF